MCRGGFSLRAGNGSSKVRAMYVCCLFVCLFACLLAYLFILSVIRALFNHYSMAVRNKERFLGDILGILLLKVLDLKPLYVLWHMNRERRSGPSAKLS